MKIPAMGYVGGAVLLAVSVVSMFGQTTHKIDPSSFDPNTPACTDFY